MQQVAERGRQQRGEEKVEVGKVAGGPAGNQQQASARALAFGIGFARQAAMNELAEGQADDGMAEIIHAWILPGFPLVPLSRHERMRSLTVVRDAGGGDDEACYLGKT